MKSSVSTASNIPALAAEKLVKLHPENRLRLTDQQLVMGLKQGDEAAFRELVETRQGLVYNTVLGLLQNAEDAEDVSQEVFSTWLYRVAVTTALEFLRKKKRKKRFAFLTSLFGEDQSPLHDPPDFVHPGVQLDNREKAKVLFQAIKKLPENQRIAFTLHKVEGLSYQEVADIMPTTVAAVESLIHRARQNLKKILRDYYESES